LAPALRENGFITVYYCAWQGSNVSMQLKDAIAEAVRQQADGLFLLQGEALDELLVRVCAATGKPVALLLDQFEDYVRCHQRTATSDEIDAELAQAVNCRQGQIVIALHDRALRTFDRFSHLIPNLLGHRLPLPPLTQDTARAVIRQTAAERGIPIEDAVVEAFATAGAAAVGNGVHPWLLTQGLNRLLEAAHNRKPAAATTAGVQVLGGADAVILHCLDSEINELNKSHRELLFRWCDVLISPEGSRAAVTEKALRERGGNHGRYTPILLPLLLSTGILRVLTIGGTQRYELAREPMAVVLKDWWSREEEGFQARRRAKFRVRSMTITATLIAVFYAIWLFYSR
jgi:hypothetical protein